MARATIIKNGFHLKYIPAGRLNDLIELADAFPYIKNKAIALYKFMEIFSSILERSMNTDSQFVPVHYDTLRKKIGVEKGVKLMLQGLLNARFLEVDKSSFKIGECSYSYKAVYNQLEMVKVYRNPLRATTDAVLNDSNNAALADSELILYNETINKITLCDDVYDVIYDMYNTNTDNIIYPYNHSSVPCLKLLKELLQSDRQPHHSSEAYEVTGILPSELISLYRIMTGQLKFPVRPIANSRVYTNITNLKREFRPCLRLNGEPLVGFDIANSQPLIAAIAFRKYSEIRYGYIKDDVLEYQAACERGKFYEYFMELNGIDTTREDERGEFKARFFGQVFYSMNYTNESKLKKQFIDKYQTCNEAIYQLKGGRDFSKDYKQFPAIMTEIETEIMWETNVELIKEGYDVVNIFDSLYSDSQEAITKAKRKVKDKFAKYGITPTLKDIDYKTSNSVEKKYKNQKYIHHTQ